MFAGTHSHNCSSPRDSEITPFRIILPAQRRTRLGRYVQYHVTTKGTYFVRAQQNLQNCMSSPSAYCTPHRKNGFPTPFLVIYGDFDREPLIRVVCPIVLGCQTLRHVLSRIEEYWSELEGIHSLSEPRVVWPRILAHKVFSPNASGIYGDYWATVPYDSVSVNIF